MAAIANILSGFGMLIGLICVIYPLRFMYIRDRRTGVAVLSIAFVTFVISAVADGKEQEKAQQQQQALAAPPPKPPKSVDELADEACNVSGAIPNCHEVVAKKIAEEAAFGGHREGYHEQARAQAPAQQTQAGPVVHEMMKCEDREALENSMGLEMTKRAIPVAKAKLAIGDVPPELRERMENAVAKAEATIAQFRAEHPCL